MTAMKRAPQTSHVDVNHSHASPAEREITGITLDREIAPPNKLEAKE
jgi:hypothetical protein